METLSDVMFWREMLTVIAFGMFLGICYWAYSGKNKDEFQAASQIVFLDDEANAELDKAKQLAGSVK